MKRNHVFTTHNLVMMAVLAAMQIVLSRFVGLQISDTLRLSFESIPVVLAGLWLGPLCGGIVAFVADTIGTLISGYLWFPPLALNPVMEGVVAGLMARCFIKSDINSAHGTWKVALTAALTGVLNAFVVGLIGSTLYSIMIMGNATAFPVLLWSNLLQRLTTKPLTIAVNVIAVTVINRTVYKPVISRIVSRA